MVGGGQDYTTSEVWLADDVRVLDAMVDWRAP